MADKGFVLTVVAVLALAILAGGLRNTYSGALTRSYDAPGYSTTNSYSGFVNYQSLGRNSNPCRDAWQKQIASGVSAQIANRDRINCEEARVR